ncbi:TetR family transcriptional regulator [Glaciihabitans arcticus]|uniref:TetR family transcriptional regulator n=1 Tax=Glaciihabitans arcticus TaxID=2668039 RepID=A0A4Q9GUX6_9MICO|nr:TetR family transcriptional regulator C-terminal domain-containing protein [Glaciihabitans arcticus]TBN57418.1 TetR family transcriptional regulator [Glaciihabitans arcticus]
MSMPRMSSVDRRLALVHAALRVIAAQGVSGATTRAIVAEARMSLASFHYAFTSRDEMMRELIVFVVENETSAAFASVDFGQGIRHALRDGLQGYFDNVVADPGHEQVMFELMQYALRTPELEDLASEQYVRYRFAVVQLLAAAAERTGCEWRIPIDDVARHVVTFTDGMTLAWLADRDSAAAARVMDFAADSLAQLAQPATASPSPKESAS